MNSRRMGIGLPAIIAALAALFLVFTPASAETSPVYWTGQGTSGDNLNTVLCGTANGAQVDGAYLLWVFTVGGGSNTVTNAELTVNGVEYGVFTQTGNQIKFVTPYIKPTLITSAFVTFDGVTGSGNVNLTISHGCPGGIVAPNSLRVTKSAISDVCNGATVTYSYEVTNTSTDFSWTGTLSDDQLGDISDGPFTLGPGDSESFTATADITGTVTNTATASGTFDDSVSTVVSVTTDPVTVTGHVCSITVEKSVDVDDVCNGSTTAVVYTYKITNNSDEFTWTGSLSDDQLDDIDTSITIGPGGSETFTANATIGGTVTNVATASGTFDDPNTTSDSDTASATVTGHDCTISVVKTASVDDVCTGSETSVTYTYEVTNTGDLFNASGTVTDDQLGAIGSFGPLAPGESETLTKTTTITGSVTNIATADATFDDADATTDSDTSTATVTGHTCSISLEKSVDISDVCTGSLTDVVYTYKVTNTGDFFAVSGSVVDDNGTPDDDSDDVTVGTFGPLDPGDSEELTLPTQVSGSVTNVATATGNYFDPASTSNTATGSATVTGHICSISLTKTPSVSDVCNGAGTQVTYTYVVQNTGDFFDASGTVTDDNGTADDDSDDFEAGTFTDLPPGETTSFTHTALINGTTTNVATASGTSGGASVSDTAEATVTGHTCSISLTKTPSKTSYCGTSTSVTYTFVVKNTGDFFAASGSVTDDKLGAIGSFGPLAPGASQTLTKTATITGSVTNVATASGTSGGAEVSATATATVTNSGTCPLTPGYWKTHDKQTAALLPISLGNYNVTTFAQAKAVFDGMNCSSSTAQGAVGCLAGHLLASKLNVKNGAGSSCIAATIAAADQFLKDIGYTGPAGTYTLTATQRAYAISLKSTLDAFNNSQGC